MKSIKDIFNNHIKSNPIFKKLDNLLCYKKIKMLFELKIGINQRVCSSIEFMYQKNDIFFIAINHPAYKMELDYNKAKIIKLLNDLNKDEQCINVLKKVTKIKSFIPTKILAKRKKQELLQYKPPRYKEKALGIFLNLSKDEILHEKFENIRKFIKENNEKK